MGVFTRDEVELERARTLLGGYALVQSSRELPEDVSLNFEGIRGRIQNLLAFAGLGATCGRRILYRLIGSSALCVVLSLITGSLFVLLITPLHLLYEYASLQRQAYTRAEGFEKDYPALLLSLASAIRTGMDPLAALLHSGPLFQSGSQMARELGILKSRIDDGAGEDDAIRAFASSIRHPDINLFRTAFILARRQGSSLGGCLHRLTRVTRQRQSFRRKVRSAVAMQKFSSLGIAGCAVGIGMMQFFMNPGAMKDALNHPIGSKLLAAGCLLMLAGMVWMLRIGRTRI